MSITTITTKEPNMAVRKIKPKPETTTTSVKDTKKADERKTGGSRWRKLARKTLGFKGG